jgi:hypothetical protein
MNFLVSLVSRELVQSISGLNFLSQMSGAIMLHDCSCQTIVALKKDKCGC